jgi:hypothetical protein
MTGMVSKRLMVASRYADPVTVDHIIQLKKELAEAVRQRDNALDMCSTLVRMNKKLNDEIWGWTDPEKRRDP